MSPRAKCHPRSHLKSGLAEKCQGKMSQGKTSQGKTSPRAKRLRAECHPTFSTSGRIGFGFGYGSGTGICTIYLINRVLSGNKNIDRFFFSGISIWHFLFEYMDAVRVQNFPKVNSHWLNVYIFGFSLTYNNWGTIWSPQILPKSESIAALFVKFIPVKLWEKSV